jgi:hypothetical protein
MKATLAFGFAHATLISPPFSQSSIFELRFAIEIIRSVPGQSAIGNRQSKIENEEAERIGIEPTSPLA